MRVARVYVTHEGYIQFQVFIGALKFPMDVFD